MECMLSHGEIFQQYGLFDDLRYYFMDLTAIDPFQSFTLLQYSDRLIVFNLGVALFALQWHRLMRPL